MAINKLAIHFGCRRVRKWLHAHEAMLTRGGVFDKHEFSAHRTNWRAASNSLSSGTQSFPVPDRRPGRAAGDRRQSEIGQRKKNYGDRTAFARTGTRITAA